MTICSFCAVEFTPKKMGYNAKYCSPSCKARAAHQRLKINAPEKLKKYARSSYKYQKQNPERMERRRQDNRKYVKATRDWLAQYKLSIGCVDCGFKGHYAALQLDHEGVKSVSIADARSSISRLQKEIESGKCKVRCANCHSIKTWERKQLKLRDRT